MRKISLCIIFLMFASGCSLFRKDIKIDGNLETDRVILFESTNSLEQNNQNIGQLSQNIQSKANSAIKKAPNVEEIPLIKQDASNISMLSGQNLQTIVKLKELNVNLSDRKKELDELKVKIEKLQNDSYKKIKGMWLSIASICAFIFVGSIFLTFLYSPKMGIPLMLCSLTTSIVATFMSTHLHIMVFVGGLIVLVIFIMLIYKAWSDREAFKEGVMSMEISKKKEWTEEIKEKVDHVQSDLTKEKVKQVKKELTDKGYYDLPEK